MGHPLLNEHLNPQAQGFHIWFYHWCFCFSSPGLAARRDGEWQRYYTHDRSQKPLFTYSLICTYNAILSLACSAPMIEYEEPLTPCRNERSSNRLQPSTGTGTCKISPGQCVSPPSIHRTVSDIERLSDSFSSTSKSTVNISPVGPLGAQLHPLY